MTSLLRQIETNLENFFKHRLPQLSDSNKETLVKITPWFTILSLIIYLPIITILFVGLSINLVPLIPATVNGGYLYSLHVIISVGIVILEALAIRGLIKRQAKAWRLLYHAALLSIIDNLLGVNLFGALIGGGLSLYLLFQIKSKYK